MKNIRILVIIVISFISCSKDDDDPDASKVSVPIGSIAVEINGKTETFNVDTRAVIDTIPWSFGRNAVKLSISGKSTGDQNSENILIWFFVTPEREIDAGTYPDLEKQIYHFLEYNSDWRGDLYNYGSNRYVNEYYSSRSSITRIDSVIKGTFTGNLGIGTGAVGEEQPPRDYKMRNGQFNLVLEK
ncbi:hypothetical protein SAMN06296241_2053 [Salinimicrobium sediminis]|uniref:Uncharacterized protein n=1 Tax=Salinimicrobium sediminis TaxID=1343891 RepID=A0A285X574_9FLAO|nr:hypothetical protein [Salinimicrobium sediminis]SOC80503.1 hypothetical protein SAMN06296241_2053 [Salinimicrobium sediminis]